MKLIQITSENIGVALEIQNAIFPSESAQETYMDSISYPSSDLVYWLLQEGDVFVGVSGLYSFQTEPESAWLGWFGILEKYRRNGYGSDALALFEEYAKKNGYLYVRLYTGRDNNDIAKKFYKENGYVEEQYECLNDPAQEKISIFSKSLYNDKELPMWDNKMIIR